MLNIRKMQEEIEINFAENVRRDTITTIYNYLISKYSIPETLEEFIDNVYQSMEPHRRINYVFIS